MRKAAAILLACFCVTEAGAQVVVGSKVFTESVILAELATHLLHDSGLEARHQRELGGTTVLWSALLRGDIDCYPEYTGTLRVEIFARSSLSSDTELLRTLAQENVWASRPLGFNNTYVLGMRRDVAQERSITKLSDLVSHPELRFGFSNEFLNRADGWPGVQRAYALPQFDIRGMAHDLAYRALAEKSVDVTDLYSTDAEIAYYDLLPLADDRAFFPAYEALFICRDDVDEVAKSALNRLAGALDESTMATLNARAKLDRIAESQVAADFARQKLGVHGQVATDSRAQRITQRTLEHLAMVSVSLLLAICVAVPAGVFAHRAPRFGHFALASADILQTIPALALLVFLIPPFGIGYAPAIVALFVYSLLPILRNTHAGLADIPRELTESATALGLSRVARLRYVELPLAARSILAGIKTAAVINVGTATLGALIGAGGYGQPILTGIRLDDLSLILEGAIPAALLALIAQAAFGAIERRWVKAK